MESLWQDWVYALRSLRRSPAYTLIAVALLALGIGAVTAVFSAVYAVMLRPLPYPAPQRLLQLVRTGFGDAVGVPEFEFVQEHATGFEAVSIYRPSGERMVTLGGAAEWIRPLEVSGGFLRTLGVAPALGREFLPEELRPGGPPAVILSDALWQRAFAGDPAAVGRSIQLDNVTYTVAGVLPRSFWFRYAADALVPFTARDIGANQTMIARLKTGVGMDQAAAQLGAFTAGLTAAIPRGLPDGYRGLTLILYQGLSNAAARTNLLLLLGAVVLLLVIACSNLAGLALARFAMRRREVAVRLALGSGAGRLFRQFLAENVVLSAAGGVAGLLVAVWLLEGLLAIVPFELPSAAPIGLNLPVLAFSFAAVVIANLIFSLAPLLSAARLDVHETLQTGGRASAGAPRQRTRSALVAGQVAVSVTLLVCAALLIQSLYQLRRQELGFAPQGLLTFRTPVSLERRGQTEELRQFYAFLQERLRALPGVRGVSAINVLPLDGGNNFPAQREGHPEHSMGPLEIRIVTPEYFQTMGIPILRGRPFGANDVDGAPPVVLVSEGLAREWWTEQENPLGDRVVLGRFRDQDYGSASPLRIVGVVADARNVSVRNPPRAMVYVPAAQAAPGDMSWVLRADRAAALGEALRQVVRDLDPRQRVERVLTMEQIVAGTMQDSRFDAWLFGSLAGVALLLTAVGVYGLLAFSVARRTHEIGTRMALGATPGRVLRLVLRQGATLVAIGLAAGLAAAQAATPLLASLLFGVTPADGWSFAVVSAALMGVGLLASYLPARRATAVDPMVALRSE